MKTITQIQIAKQVGVDSSFISQILNDFRPCPPALAPDLERVTGIDRTLWVWGTKEDKLSAWKHFTETHMEAA